MRYLIQTFSKWIVKKYVLYINDLPGMPTYAKNAYGLCNYAACPIWPGGLSASQHNTGSVRHSRGL